MPLPQLESLNNPRNELFIFEAALVHTYFDLVLAQKDILVFVKGLNKVEWYFYTGLQIMNILCVSNGKVICQIKI